MTISARYENGVFRPLEPVKIFDGTVVEVVVAEPSIRPPSLADSPFAGMWKDREDLGDSVDCIDRLRSKLHP